MGFELGSPFLAALNGTLIDSTALAGTLPANLRSAAGVYSTAQVDALLDAIEASLQGNIDGKEPTIAAGTSAQIWQGDKTWVAKTALPISTATQTALDAKLTTTALTGAALATSGIDARIALKDGAFVTTSAEFVDASTHGFLPSASAAVNTAQFLVAYVEARTAGKALFIPDGAYNVNRISIAYAGFNNQVSIFGNPGRKVRLVKASADGDGLFQLSDAAAAGYTALLRFSNIVFEGFSIADTDFAFRGYDLARCYFDNCQFTKAAIGLDLKGGIANIGYGCTFDANGVGINVKKYTGGYDGWPNLNSFDSSRIINNTQWAVDFDDGMVLPLRNCDIEGNGTSGNSSTGGVRVGANIGSKDGITAPGVIADGGTWFEANAGNAAFQAASGLNTVRDSFFVANANATYDSYVSGGFYNFDNNLYANNKTNNHFETVGIGTGNFFTKNSHAGGVTIDAAKTVIQDKDVTTAQSLRAMVVSGIKVRDYLNRVIINAFSNGTPDSWLEFAADVGLASISTGSSLSNADLFLTPKGTGLAKITNPRIVSKAAPSSASDTGVQGEIRWASGFVYVCTATNTWQRTAIASW